jgi:hypothetical protein
MLYKTAPILVQSWCKPFYLILSALKFTVHYALRNSFPKKINFMRAAVFHKQGDISVDNVPNPNANLDRDHRIE